MERKEMLRVRALLGPKIRDAQIQRMTDAGLTSEEAECAWVRNSRNYLNAWKEYLEAGLIELEGVDHASPNFQIKIMESNQILLLRMHGRKLE